MGDLTAAQTIASSVIAVVVAVLGFLGTRLTARLNAKAASRTTEVAEQKQIAEQRQADIDGWQALLTEHRTDRKHYRDEIQELSEKVEHLTMRVERVERRYKVSIGYTHEVIEWGSRVVDQAVAAGVRLLRPTPPPAPADIADEF